MWPRILDDPRYGPSARELYDNARSALDRIVAEGRLRAAGVYGFFPAAGEEDDIVLFTDDERQVRTGQDPHHAPAGLPRRRPPAARAGRLRRPAGIRSSRLRRRLRRHRRPGYRGDRRQPRAGARRLRRDHGQGPGRPAGRGLRRDAAPAGAPRTGVTAATRAHARGSDPRTLPRNPPGTRLSRLPGPLDQAHAVRSARPRARRRDPLDRELRHASRQPR